MACTNCGENFPLYGDRLLCFLCLDTAVSDPSLTDYSAEPDARDAAW